MKKEFSEENIDFWVKCENYKRLTDPDEMRKEADDIWSTYLDTASMHQINVDSKARSRCKEGLQCPSSTMFEAAQTQIFTLMKLDSYTRFLKSQMYKDCIVNEMEGKPLLTNISKSNTNVLKAKLLLANQSNTQNQIVYSPLNNNSNPNLANTTLSNDNIPNASSTIAAAVACVASTGAAVLSTVPPQATGASATAAAATATIMQTFNAASNSISSPQLNTTNTNNPSSSNLFTIQATASNSNINNTNNNNNNNNNSKEKKRSTIIPWTKGNDS